MTPSQKVSWGVGTGLFVLVVVLLALSIPRCGPLHREEATLAHPDRSWDHAPLTVACRGYVPEEDGACTTARDVIETINTRVGFPLLAWTDVDHGRDIDITMRAPVEMNAAQVDGAWSAACSRPGECFKLARTGTVYTHCDVQTMNVSGGAGNLEWLVLYHGLGHCLGLAHDDYKQSIMYFEQEETPDRTIPPWFSDDDRAVLREKYR